MFHLEKGGLQTLGLRQQRVTSDPAVTPQPWKRFDFKCYLYIYVCVCMCVYIYSIKYIYIYRYGYLIGIYTYANIHIINSTLGACESRRVSWCFTCAILIGHILASVRSLRSFGTIHFNPSIGSSGISFLGFHADADPPKLSIYPMGRYLKMNGIVSDYHFPVYETPCWHIIFQHLATIGMLS